MISPAIVTLVSWVLLGVKLLSLFPSPQALLEFLSKVVARENNNKMNLWNVSTVMAPNLFMHKGLPNKIPEGKEKQLAEGAADVVRMMIHYQDLLWTVSCTGVPQYSIAVPWSGWNWGKEWDRLGNFRQTDCFQTKLLSEFQDYLFWSYIDTLSAEGAS